MSRVHELLEAVRRAVAPDAETLEAARTHREAVLSAAVRLPGALRTYASGSIAHGTANDDTDADCGVVLDRRSWPDLGPDGLGVAPNDVVADASVEIRGALSEAGWDVQARLTKRAIQFNFPYGPNVDLIVGLTRKEGRGLWIPNLKCKDWDASHPEQHTKLLTAEPKSLRVTRARAVRLAKAWNKQSDKPVLCSFNIEALALAAVEPGMAVPQALLAIADYGATDLAVRLTPDPADVSPPIKTPVDREIVVARLDAVARALEKAMQSSDEAEVQDLIASIFPRYVEPADEKSQASVASSLRGGNEFVKYTGGAIATAAGAWRAKTTRSFGG